MIRRALYLILLIIMISMPLSAADGLYQTDKGDLSGSADVLASFDLNDIEDNINIGFTSGLAGTLKIGQDVTPLKSRYFSPEEWGENNPEISGIQIYYQIVSADTVTLTVSVAGPLLHESIAVTDYSLNALSEKIKGTDEDYKLGWDIRFSDDTSTITIKENDDVKQRELHTHYPQDGIGQAGYWDIRIDAMDTTYMKKAEGNYYGYIYLTITKEGEGQ